MSTEARTTLDFAERIERAAEVVLYDHETRSEYLDDMERELIVRVLKDHAGRIATTERPTP